MLRRAFLKGAGAAALGLLTGCRAAEAPAEETLADAARPRGLRYGASVAYEVYDDPAYAELYRRQVGILTTDWALKFDAIRPDRATWWFDGGDDMLAFARGIGAPLRGHALVWNENAPGWLWALVEAGELAEVRRVFDEHVERVVDRYRGRLHSWDVVNEPFWPGHGLPGGWRDGPWYRAYGEGYVRRAFELARRHDPEVRLVLNEAHTERMDDVGEAVRRGLVGLVRELLDAGVDLYAVGLQGHLYAYFEETTAYDYPRFAAFVHELGELGVRVFITELDVSDEWLIRQGKGAAERDAWVAEQYRSFLGEVLQVPAVEVVITWQLADKYSWLRAWAPVRPLPFDDALRPKPAFHALREALATAPAR